MIGSLLYLTASRSDILFNVSLSARYQACPEESHLKVVKRIFEYFKATIDLRLWYLKNINFDIKGYLTLIFSLVERIEKELVDHVILRSFSYLGLVRNQI